MNSQWRFRIPLPEESDLDLSFSGTRAQAMYILKAFQDAGRQHGLKRPRLIETRQIEVDDTDTDG